MLTNSYFISISLAYIFTVMNSVCGIPYRSQTATTRAELTLERRGSSADQSDGAVKGQADKLTKFSQGTGTKIDGVQLAAIIDRYRKLLEDEQPHVITIEDAFLDDSRVTIAMRTLRTKATPFFDALGDIKTATDRASLRSKLLIATRQRPDIDEGPFGVRAASVSFAGSNADSSSYNRLSRLRGWPSTIIECLLIISSSPSSIEPTRIHLDKSTWFSLDSISRPDPTPTPTGLPGELDFRIADTPTYIPTETAGGIWSDLSQAPTTRLGERWDKLEEAAPLSPTALWYEPDSILPPSSTAGPSSSATPLHLHPPDHPLNLQIQIPQSRRCTQNDEIIQETTSILKNSQKNAQPSTSSLPATVDDRKLSPPVNLKIPTGQFVTESPPQKEKAKYQLGSTEFGYGSIHLYRDFEEASAAKKSNDQSLTISSSSNHQKNPQKSGPSARQDSLGTAELLNQWNELNDDHRMIVGVLAIPSYMTSQDFLAFISPIVESIESVRMLRDSVPNRCIGLIKFRSSQAAEHFASEFNGKPFSHLQDREICHTAFIRSVRFKSSLIPPFTFPALLPPDLLTHSAHELPTCPVCLERMDVSVTGLMTKTCSHTFHCHCLSNWGDSRCPICRYSESKLNKSSTPDQSECAACGSQANLWICLICGHVGCGRYQGGHAYRHFEESAHLYALELGSQRVWDYVGDNYVHRLIQTKSDQIVELPALSSAVFDSGGGPGRNEVAYQSKIEAISEEFGHLVASQLDSQRAFYEEEMEILRNQLQTTQEEAEEQKSLVKKLQTQLQNIEESNQSLEKLSKKEKSTMLKKTGKTLQISQKLENELKEEQLMSVGMRAQIKKLEEEKHEEKSKTLELSKEIVDIKEQLRDMMFFIEMQSKIQNNEGGTSELQGGSIVVGKPASSTLNESKGDSNKK
ncbi:hypothetical protein KEM48_004473 [Puccinia striiformis f. sp. tritici PST-130]|nr:hypothetical protein KEM48_004473 [Puccinia striiformis f. sp. tritici PST-130]